MSAALDPETLQYLVQQYFGDLGPEAVQTMLGIINAESSGVPDAFNPNDPYGGSFGLAQINGSHGYDSARLRSDPAYNIWAARQVYDQQGFPAWSTYTNGSYAQSLGDRYPAMQYSTAGNYQPVSDGVPSTPFGGGNPAQTPTQNVVTGADILKLAAYLQNLNTQTALMPSSVTGMYPADWTGGQAGQWNPTWARLLGSVNSLTQLQGPQDWLKYNYALRNLSPNANPIDQMRAGIGDTAGQQPQAQPQAPVQQPQQPAQPQGMNALSALDQLYNSKNLNYDQASNQARGLLSQAYGDSGQPQQAQQYLPQLAFGGQARNAAVVGDPQRGNQANPELAMSQAPITVVPLRDLSEQARMYMNSIPHAATGGIVDAPFFKGLQNGGLPAFGASGLNSALGAQPFSYANYLRLNPSEQSMLQGYINTPGFMGGAGGYFPDELARSQRAAVMGSSFAPSTYG